MDEGSQLLSVAECADLAIEECDPLLAITALRAGRRNVTVLPMLQRMDLLNLITREIGHPEYATQLAVETDTLFSPERRSLIVFIAHSRYYKYIYTCLMSIEDLSFDEKDKLIRAMCTAGLQDSEYIYKLHVHIGRLLSDMHQTMLYNAFLRLRDQAKPMQLEELIEEIKSR